MIRHRTVKRVCWDGPNPRQGDFLLARHSTAVWLIQRVTVHRGNDATGARLTLDLSRQSVPPPSGSIVHPASRVQPSNPTGPARVRQIMGSGPTAVMPSNWRDPTDMIPNASRRPRDIQGYRTYCALRRMASVRGSRITPEHILAADQFRTQVDAAVIGLTGERDPGAVGQGYGPRAGPSEAALQQALSSRVVGACLARFAPSHVAMLVEVVLRNVPIAIWCKMLNERSGQDHQEKIEMGRLLTILDILAVHYAAGIKADRATGAVLEPV